MNGNCLGSFISVHCRCPLWKLQSLPLSQVLILSLVKNPLSIETNQCPLSLITDKYRHCCAHAPWQYPDNTLLIVFYGWKGRSKASTHNDIKVVRPMGASHPDHRHLVVDLTYMQLKHEIKPRHTHQWN